MTSGTDDHDERSLIEAAQADPARFVDLYECHFHRVYAYVARRAVYGLAVSHCRQRAGRHVATELARLAMVCQLVERLPDAQRQVIEMPFVDQKSIREIADALGRSEGAVKQLQLRALENLRKCLEGPRWLTRSSIGWIRPSTGSWRGAMPRRRCRIQSWHCSRCSPTS